MGKAGEKQKRKPKIKDKRQSERFKEADRAAGADESSDAFDRIIKQMANAGEVRTQLVRSADLIQQSKDDDAKRHVRKTAEAIKESKRLLKTRFRASIRTRKDRRR